MKTMAFYLSCLSLLVPELIKCQDSIQKPDTLFWIVSTTDSSIRTPVIKGGGISLSLSDHIDSSTVESIYYDIGGFICDGSDSAITINVSGERKWTYYHNQSHESHDINNPVDYKNRHACLFPKTISYQKINTIYYTASPRKEQRLSVINTVSAELAILGLVAGTFISFNYNKLSFNRPLLNKFLYPTTGCLAVCIVSGLASNHMTASFTLNDPYTPEDREWYILKHGKTTKP